MNWKHWISTVRPGLTLAVANLLLVTISGACALVAVIVGAIMLRLWNIPPIATPAVFAVFVPIAVVTWLMLGRKFRALERGHWMSALLGISPLLALSLISFAAATLTIAWPRAEGFLVSAPLFVGTGSFFAAIVCVACLFFDRQVGGAPTES
ncbi:MAG: hypothetical protein KDM64_11035 [Verrucomicrobiae bacterium]|nr:hypothetical protein [Verrucomicrobiae bacterium]